MWTIFHVIFFWFQITWAQSTLRAESATSKEKVVMLNTCNPSTLTDGSGLEPETLVFPKPTNLTQRHFGAQLESKCEFCLFDEGGRGFESGVGHKILFFSFFPFHTSQISKLLKRHSVEISGFFCHLNFTWNQFWRI